MKFQFIDQHKQNAKIFKMCKSFGVSIAGYYQWKNRCKSRREIENDNLLIKIQEIYKKD